MPSDVTYSQASPPSGIIKFPREGLQFERAPERLPRPVPVFYRSGKSNENQFWKLALLVQNTIFVMTCLKTLVRRGWAMPDVFFPFHNRGKKFPNFRFPPNSRASGREISPLTSDLRLRGASTPSTLCGKLVLTSPLSSSWPPSAMSASHPDSSAQPETRIRAVDSLPVHGSTAPGPIPYLNYLKEASCNSDLNMSDDNNSFKTS